MDDIYSLADVTILERIGQSLRQTRLQQDISQQGLADAAMVSLSTVRKIEKGEIRTVDALLRVLRTLGRLDVLQPLVEEEQISPNEYYELMQTALKRRRRRASKTNNNKTSW